MVADLTVPGIADTVQGGAQQTPDKDKEAHHADGGGAAGGSRGVQRPGYSRFLSFSRSRLRLPSRDITISTAIIAMMKPKLTISSAHPPTPLNACAGGATGIANVPKNPINQHTPPPCRFEHVILNGAQRSEESKLSRER